MITIRRLSGRLCILGLHFAIILSLWIDYPADADSEGHLDMSRSNGFELIVAPATKENPRNSEGDVIELANGDLLLAWSDFYGGGSDDSAARISAMRSSDGGHSWSRRYTLQENVGTENVMSVSFLRSRSGDILFFYGVKNSSKDLKFYVRRSDDDGESFHKPVCVTSDAGYHVMNNARVIQLPSGRILAPMSVTSQVWTSDESFVNVVYYSDDDGRTWHRSKGVVKAPKRGAMEPGLVRLRDGRILQIIRTQMGEIWQSFSEDDGETWTESEPMGVKAPEAPATIVRIPSTGDLLLVWNPEIDPSHHHYGKRCPLSTAISRDEGRTWENVRILEDDAAYTYAYTSCTFIGNDVALTYYVCNADSSLISLRFRRIPVKWLYISSQQQRKGAR